MAKLSCEEAIRQLEDSRSAKRRSAARRLREIADPRAGEALLAALMRETRDRRSWETRGLMVCAIGELGYGAALEFLRQWQDWAPFGAEQHAVGYARALLADSLGSLPAEVDALFASSSRNLIEGAFHALALRRLVPSEATVRRILAHVTSKMGPGSLHWVCAAAAGWPYEGVEAFLLAALARAERAEGTPAGWPFAETKLAAVAALKGEYLDWPAPF